MLDDRAVLCQGVSMTDARHIGETVLLLRSEQGWTQAELAGKAGVHHRTIQDMERQITTPRMATCIRIARALGVSVDRLIGKQREGTAA